MKNPERVNLAIFASGAGSNARNIISHFKSHSHISVKLIITDQPAAGVISIAQEAGIHTIIIEREKFFKEDAYLPELQSLNIHFLILAGFMRKIPAKLVSAFQGKILNIHPALLPKYGGKGMYGSRVHEAVLLGGERESGITIHYVDEIYDNGEIIFQEKCEIDNNETPASLANKVHALEHAHYPLIIEKVILEKMHQT